MTLAPLLENGWLNAILPELILSIGGIVLILFDAFAPKLRGATAPLAVMVFLAAGWSERLLVGGNFFGGTYQVSQITVIFDCTFLLAAIVYGFDVRGGSTGLPMRIKGTTTPPTDEKRWDGRGKRLLSG